MSTTKPTAEEFFCDNLNEWMKFLLLKTLILTFSFHTEHNQAPEFSRNTSTYMRLLQSSLSLSLSLSLCFCVGGGGVVVVEG